MTTTFYTYLTLLTEQAVKVQAQMVTEEDFHTVQRITSDIVTEEQLNNAFEYKEYKTLMNTAYIVRDSMRALLRR